MINTSEKPISDFWPMAHSTPRKTQEDVLAWIEQLPSNIKYILCEVPVGGGKSPLAVNVSGWLGQGVNSHGDAYILTPQKILQKQYEDSFDEKYVTSLYGKANYSCENKNTNCELGDLIKPRCTDCPHKAAMAQSEIHPNVVLNYTLAFLLFKFASDSKFVRKRKLMIMDEGHTLEHHLTEFDAITINERKCNLIKYVAYKNMLDMKSAHTWLVNVYAPALHKRVKELAAQSTDIIQSCEASGRNPTKDEMAVLTLLSELRRHYSTIEEEALLTTYENFAETYVLVNDGKNSFKFKELFGKRIFKKFVEPMADKFLIMSSTILDKKSFCEDLGIDPDATAFISTDSEFEASNRPIFYLPTAKMAYGWDKDENRQMRKQMVNKIKEILNLHKADSGIIHAGSFQVAKWLTEELEGKIPHVLYHHNPGSEYKRDVVIDLFQEDNGIPKLLISPSITEGLDLKDDKGRFAIFAKVPYPFLGDAWVKRRLDISSKWYARQTLTAMIQGSGRVVRSKDDWGYTYILDSSFERLLSTAKTMIPKWWMKSIE